MHKLIGSILIISASTAMGFSESFRLMKREKRLEKIILALRLLENEIEYSKRDIKTVLKIIGEENNLEFFCKASADIEEKGIYRALSDTAEKYESDILGTDKSVLDDLWRNLGMSDSRSQVKSIRCTLSRLEEARESASRDYAATGKLKRSMGFLIGAFAVILLL